MNIFNIKSLFACLLLCGMLVSCSNLELPDENVCYETHIVPLIERDCARCHENGEYNIKLNGKKNDYNELLRYIDYNAPKNSRLLAYTLGELNHPALYNKDYDEYKTLLAWISEGARQECVDIQTVGECSQDSHCLEISCVCPDRQIAFGAKCYVNPESGKGTCMTEDNCADSMFGLCTPSNNNNDDDTEDDDDATDDDDNDDISIDDDDDNDDNDDEVSPVYFSSQITPMIRADCARCHNRGQYRIKLVGDSSDYSEVRRYVDVNNPEDSTFQKWAAGYWRHPLIWAENGAKYNLFMDWVKQGAKND